MATILDSREVERSNLPRDEILWAYNALDSAVTVDIHDKLRDRLWSNAPEAAHARLSYNFVRSMQGPALAMMKRGVAIQLQVRADETERLTAERHAAQALLDELADAVWGPEAFEVRRKEEVFEERVSAKTGKPLKPLRRVAVHYDLATRPRGLNAGSTKQCLEFFNGALGMPHRFALRKTAHGTERTPSADKKALKSWETWKAKGAGVDTRDRKVSWVRLAKPFVVLVLAIRDMDKQLEALTMPLDPDNRMRCTYSPASTETGRWSSQKNVFGRGSNLQNQSPRARRMFAADDGYWFVSTDYEQAESRMVAALAWQATGQDAYWRACEAADLHLSVCRMTWPELPWTGDDEIDIKLAKQPYPDYPNLSWRDFAKRLGHSANYGGGAQGVALSTGIPSGIVSAFQAKYLAAFPEIPLWHQALIAELQQTSRLITPLGRLRWFFDRTNDDATIREAIAYVPQSSIAELLNEAMRRVWMRSMLPADDPRFLPVELLLQNHDAFAFQTPLYADVPFVLDEVRKELEIPVPFVRNGQDWNWGA
jgi:hypothetical protein